MKKNVFYVLLLFVAAIVIAGSSYIYSSYSLDSYPINKEGNYYITGGKGVILNGISCYLSDYSSNNYDRSTSLINSYSNPNHKDTYLFKVNKSSNGYNCDMFPYKAGTVTIQCNKNYINTGESTSCTAKSVTSSDGVKSVSFKVSTDKLVLKNFSSNYFEVVDNNDKTYTFVAKRNNLLSNTEYLLAAFDIVNNGEYDGHDNSISFNNITYVDNIVSLDVGSSTLVFTEGKGREEENTTSSGTTTTTVTHAVTEGIGNMPKTGESHGISGVVAVLLTVFIATMSIALGILITTIFKKKN